MLFRVCHQHNHRPRRGPPLRPFFFICGLMIGCCPYCTLPAQVSCTQVATSKWRAESFGWLASWRMHWRALAMGASLCNHPWGCTCGLTACRWCGDESLGESSGWAARWRMSWRALGQGTSWRRCPRGHISSMTAPRSTAQRCSACRLCARAPVPR